MTKEDEKNKTEDKTNDFEKAIKDRLKKDGISEEWMEDHLIIDFPS